MSKPLLSEYELQKSIIAECDLRANQDPRFGFILAIPNGQYRKGSADMKRKAEAAGLRIFEKVVTR